MTTETRLVEKQHTLAHSICVELGFDFLPEQTQQPGGESGSVPVLARTRTPILSQAHLDRVKALIAQYTEDLAT